jgi:GYF domain 2
VSAPNDAVWYIVRDGERFGPFNADAFTKLEEEGRFLATDRIWHSGKDTWISYADYEARKVAARLVVPDQRPSYNKRDRQKCAICRWARKGASALANALTTAFRSFPSSVSVAVDTSAASAAPDPALKVTAPASADPSQESILPSLVPVYDQSRTSGFTREQHTADLMPHDTDEVHGDGMSVITIRENRGPLQYAPRLANEEQAAAQIGLELTTFRAWVTGGRLPQALPGCDKYDMKAIHLALDRMSGIASRENPSSDWVEKLARARS